MDAVVSTRSELLDRRRRTALAEQGRDLLSDKRAALLRALNERSAALLALLAEVEQSAAAARAQLGHAYAVMGPAGVRSPALTAARGVGVEVRSSVVAGVVVVDLEHDHVRRDPLDRGHAASATDPVVDDVALAYEDVVDELLDVAALELSVRRLAVEIARTTRQVNALEHVLIPTLHDETRRIGLALEEREREEAARLRRARDRRSSASRSVS